MRYMLLMLTVTFLFLPRLAKAEVVPPINLQQVVTHCTTINSPFSGQEVHGAVVIRRDTHLDGFNSYEVDFAYSADATQTWFLIQESTRPILDGVLAVWDTTSIADGDYNLRLMITRTDGEPVEITVSHLRVRNYTPIATHAPTPSLSKVSTAQDIPTLSVTPQATSIPIVTRFSSMPTPLPTNPAEISNLQAALTISKGAVISIGFFAVLVVYVGIRTALYHR